MLVDREKKTMDLKDIGQAHPADFDRTQKAANLLMAVGPCSNKNVAVTAGVPIQKRVKPALSKLLE